jgi:hypothetical protein
MMYHFGHVDGVCPAERQASLDRQKAKDSGVRLLGEIVFGLSITLASFLAALGFWSETSFPGDHIVLALALIALKCGVIVLCGWLARMICRRSD